MGPFERVRITLTYADGRSETTPVLARWLAEWIVANEIASGYYRGRRVASARIITV